MKVGNSWLWVAGIVAFVAALVLVFTSFNGPIPDSQVINQAGNPVTSQDGLVVTPPQQTPPAAPAQSQEQSGLVASPGFNVEQGWVNYRLKVREQAGNYFASNRFNWSFYQELSLEPNTNYTLDAKVRQRASGQARICIQFYVNGQSVPEPQMLNYYHEFTGKGWEAIPTQNFCTPENLTKAVIYLMSTSTGTQDFDDIYINAVPSSGSAAAPAEAAAPSGTPAAATTPAAPANSSTQQVEYVVVPGDTIGSIASKFHTSVGAIIFANSLTDPDHIYPGQKLIIE
ncbi:MAG TPA: LysM domain-containing protein [Bacillota bacterium]|nr:LysM domain-containing protein [Bacillota bacterium]